MNQRRWMTQIVTIFMLVWTGAFWVEAQDQSPAIPDAKITDMVSKLDNQVKGVSAARRKLAVRRVIREGNSLLKTYPKAPNRFEVLGILFRSQRELMSLDGSASNRRELIEASRQLAEAPDEYAAVRLDADLLLSQAELARQGANVQARADALRPLVKRYQDTEVEPKVIRIAMLMALEFGDTKLVNHLRQVIAERFAGDLEMINFQRDKLAGQVFGAPFIGQFEQSDGKIVRFPMDYLGTTTGIYFWSKDNGGEEDLKELAVAWKAMAAEVTGRYRFVSLNLDNLPDAGEGMLRELGLDWPALRLPNGRDNPIYQAYARRDPAIITVSPTGYSALFLSGGRRSRGYERNLQSALARLWTKPRYTTQLQSMFSGEFLILDVEGDFNPAAPPEWKASRFGTSSKDQLVRTENSVPEDKLAAIQACFIKPPFRYRTPFEQAKASYEKADALCREAMATHPEAADLWIVYNRRIIALLGLWKLNADRKYFDEAVSLAKDALAKGYPSGTDLIAQYCIAMQKLRTDNADPAVVISELIQEFDQDQGTGQGTGPAVAAAAILALGAGDRRLHEQYRQDILQEHSNNPQLWTATSFMLDRYHRYWLYHPPFVAGWTYGRRQSYFLGWGQPEDANRTLHAELKTSEGETFSIPEKTAGKWTVICFASNADGSGFPRSTVEFAEARPFNDVRLIAAVLDDAPDTDAALKKKTKPDIIQTLLVPGGMQNRLVHQLGILGEDEKSNIVILRPDGTIAAALSGLTMGIGHRGNVIQNVIEWHDEQAVDEALERGDLEEAKRLTFALAPVEELTTPDQKKKPAKPISIPHQRSRAKLYMALENWEAALADAQNVFLEVNRRDGWLSLRTAELDAIEKLKDTILSAQEPQESKQ